MVKGLKIAATPMPERPQNPRPDVADRFVKAFGAQKIVNEACKAVSVCDFEWARDLVTIVLAADASLVDVKEMEKAAKLYAMIPKSTH